MLIHNRTDLMAIVDRIKRLEAEGKATEAEKGFRKFAEAKACCGNFSQSDMEGINDQAKDLLEPAGRARDYAKDRLRDKNETRTH